MRILITAGESKLTKTLCKSLSVDHEIIVTDRDDVSSDFEFVRSDLNDTDATNKLVRDVDVIVHSGQANLASTPTPVSYTHLTLPTILLV